jgi:uncharacterized protein YbaP (TraB family)
MIRRRLTATVILLIAIMAPLAADPAKIATVPEQCGGKDMIEEMRIAEPDRHRRMMDDAAKIENGGALLWKIEKEGIAASHLFGTIHVSDARVTALTDTTKQALSQSKTVALEIANMSEVGMMAAMTKVPELLAYTDGTTLKAQLTESEYAKVQQLITKTGMPGDAAAVLRPWLISTMLAISDCHRAQMEAGKKALDEQLESTAKANGAAVVGLETAESQLAAMASLPNDKQVQILKAGLAYADRTDDMIETLVQMYIKRDITATMPFQLALAEKIGVNPNIYDDFIKILITDRNLKMREAAKPLLDKGNAFVAVGSLHLPGKTGLVALLREAGYTVTPVE